MLKPLNKVVAVSGGAQGIGRGVALTFAKVGYAVSIADPVRDAGEEVATLIKSAGGTALYVCADTSIASDVARWLAATVSALGCPGVLVNNAGIMVRKPFLQLSLADFDRVQAVNVRGTFMCAQAFAQSMVSNTSPGVIINIASTRAAMSEADTESYTASKGAVVSLTHGMAISLGRYGIRVSCISPGWIETADWQFTGRSKTPHHTDRDKDQHPVGRIGTPDDIGKACLFLAEQADFMTGQNLVLDGGMSIKMIYV